MITDMSLRLIYLIVDRFFSWLMLLGRATPSNAVVTPSSSVVRGTVNARLGANVRGRGAGAGYGALLALARLEHPHGGTLPAAVADRSGVGLQGPG
jgi:hypothetical protein